MYPCNNISFDCICLQFLRWSKIGGISPDARRIHSLSCACHISSLLLNMNFIFPAHHRALQVKNRLPTGGKHVKIHNVVHVLREEQTECCGRERSVP